MVLGVDYPLLNVFLSMVWFFLLVAWLMLLFRVFADLFRSDASGAVKVLWIVLLIVLPYLGVFAYLLTQGRAMAAREVAAHQAREEALRAALRPVGGAYVSPTEELVRLADLRDRGAIDDDEYAAMKAKIIG